MLFITIALICLLLSFARAIVKGLKAVLLGFTGKNELLAALQSAIDEVETIEARNPYRPDGFADLIFLERAQQKVDDLKKLRDRHNLGQMRSAYAELIMSYILKAVLGIVLIVISIKYRYDPVLIFGEQFNLHPLKGILSFPTNVPNAISVPAWILSCNVCFNMLNEFIYS
uniref:Uncharacterized protein n=1 Tax=Glossina brevipalpis TaxID=37001 RepID=A0A1A9W6P1_9MUSC